ncbi:CHAD domain-containing protein [Ferrovibrio sp.]|uniref:CYTH and CHAD domain-containing protein n=1 Tax=Ferrovibrio sp. TaxID=1917215 RepID=UPI0035B07598
MSDQPALLRLGLAAGSLAQARRAPLLQGLPARRHQTGMMLCDTDNRRFAAAGWLCLAGSHGGEHDLLPVAGLALADPPAFDAHLALEGLAALRRTAQASSLERDGHQITIETAKLTLRCDDRNAEAGEILLQGPPGTLPILHRLAAELDADLPAYWSGPAPLVHLAATLGLIEPQPQRAGTIPFELTDDGDAASACAAILRHCLLQFDANLLPVLRDFDAEGVHQMRVALRRLRSALGLFAPMLREAVMMPLVEELRWLNGPLGRKRDLDVFLAETLAPLHRELDDVKALQHLRIILEDHRAAAQVALVSALQSPRLAALRLGFARLADRVMDGSALADADLAAQPAERFAAQMLRKRRKKVKALGVQHAELPIESLHELRIRAKKLRYAAEFFRPLFSRKDTRRFIAALSRLQDCLGALNDADVGGRLVRDLLPDAGHGTATAAITAWFAGRQQLQLAQLGDAWDDFDAIRPFWKDALKD